MPFKPHVSDFWHGSPRVSAEALFVAVELPKHQAPGWWPTERNRITESNNNAT